jgi:hypothetical protein
MVYWPMADQRFVSRDMAYFVRSDRVGAPGFLRELEQAVWSINPNLPLGKVQTLNEIQAHSMAQTSFAMVMLAIAASVALLLAVVGVYGVVSYIAAERTYELGIRMALGAQIGDVRALFLRHGLALTLAGIALGIGGAMLLTPIMSALLYGVAPTDPVTYVGAAIVLAAVPHASIQLSPCGQTSKYKVCLRHNAWLVIKSGPKSGSRVSLNFASRNQLERWFRDVGGLRQVA